MLAESRPKSEEYCVELEINLNFTQGLSVLNTRSITRIMRLVTPPFVLCDLVVGRNALDPKEPNGLLPDCRARCSLASNMRTPCMLEAE